MAIAAQLSPDIDPVRLEILKNAFLAIAEDMAAALQRSAFSTNIKTRADFSCGILDRDFRVIAQAFAQPSHLGALTHIVPSAIREYGVENLEPGDGIVMNDPHRNAAHLNDIALITPVFRDGEIIAYVTSIAHHVDVGGGAPGSLGTFSEVFAEGLIIPPVKLLKRGQIDSDIFKLILTNFRTPRESAGDFRAQVAGNRLGIRQLEALIARYGIETIFRYSGELLDYTERRIRAELATFPEGVYEAVDYMDHDGVSDDPVKIAVRVEVKGGEVVFDLSGCDRQRKGPANCTHSMAFAGVTLVLKCLTDPDIPINDGFYRAVNMISPRGTVVNCTHPAPVAGGWEVVFRLVETLFQAFAPALPLRVIAGTKGIICNIAFGGVHPRTGQLYSFYETIAGGSGARHCKDGMDAVQPHLHNTENSPVEETESNYPFRVVRVQLIQDSEGAGRYRGGLGVRRDYLFPDHDVSFSVMSDRARFAPHGLFGGKPGRVAHYVRYPESNPTLLSSKTTVRLTAGEMMSIQTPGGGGYGDALERDPEAVLRDVRDGKVSLEKARQVYRVAIDPATLRVDLDATEELRG